MFSEPHCSSRPTHKADCICTHVAMRYYFHVVCVQKCHRIFVEMTATLRLGLVSSISLENFIPDWFWLHFFVTMCLSQRMHVSYFIYASIFLEHGWEKWNFDENAISLVERRKTFSPSYVIVLWTLSIVFQNVIDSFERALKRLPISLEQCAKWINHFNKFYWSIMTVTDMIIPLFSFATSLDNILFNLNK